MTINGLRIVVIESQALFAKALCSVLAEDSDVKIVGDYRAPSHELLVSAKPTLIVLDVDGQLIDLNDALLLCQQAVPGVKVCILSMKLSPELMQRVLGAGADAYIVKDISPEELIRAVKSVSAGESYVDPRVAGGLLRRRSSLGSRAEIGELSTREADVIKLIAEGLANKQISARLNLSEKTVKNHISRIFSKLNINARTQAAVHAIKAGLV
jgi:DNA-binding NarL/FixJ family response regulator